MLFTGCAVALLHCTFSTVISTTRIVCHAYLWPWEGLPVTGGVLLNGYTTINHTLCDLAFESDAQLSPWLEGYFEHCYLWTLDVIIIVCNRNQWIIHSTPTAW